jgi:CheY-like chemotaxis protein
MTPILLVDNEPGVLRLLRLILTRAGHPVVEVRDGPTALAWMRASTESAIVLLTTMMPTATIATLLREVGDGTFPRRHACALLTATPESLPASLRPLLSGYSIPVVGVPFTSATLLDATVRAQECLDGAPTAPTALNHGA